MIKIIIYTIILLLVTSCATALPEQEELVLTETDGTITDIDADTDTVTDDIMDEPLLTAEEFLELVAEHWMTLGVTVEDFDDIDTEDFIERNFLSEAHFFDFVTEGGNFIAIFNQYSASNDIRAMDALIEPLLPTELRIVNSTEEEFERFITLFFDKVDRNSDVQFVGTSFKGLVDYYSFSRGEQLIEFAVSRTMHIEQLKEQQWIFNETRYVFVEIPTFVEEMTEGGTIFISKNGKFFIIFQGVMYPDIEVIQTFLDIDD